MQDAIQKPRCLIGCSGRLKTYPVNGKVRFKSGEPVKVGTIELKSRQQGIHARGTVDRDGSFTLTTYVAGDGAVEGKHDCVVVQFVMTEGLKGHRPSTIGVIDRSANAIIFDGILAFSPMNGFLLDSEPLVVRETGSSFRFHGLSLRR